VRRGDEYYCPLDQVGESLQLLLEVGWPILDPKGRPLALQTGMELQVAEEGAQLHLKGRVLFGQGQAPVEEVVAAYQRHARLLPLADGQVALLPKGSPLEQVRQVKIERARGGEFSTLPAVIDASLEPLLRFSGFEQVTPSEGFKGVLRLYQSEGLGWLHYLAQSGYGGVLSDEMGLGKTVQVLAFLSRLPGPHLIVAPTSLLFNWKREIERFLPGRTDIDIVSYGTLRRGIEGSYKAAILDEAQNIKNPSSQTAQAAYEIRADFRLALSGTPIENRPAELWSLFRFAMPTLLGEMRNTIEKARVRPFILRRTKAEVAKELPEKIEQTVFIELGEEQRQVYDSITGAPLERILRLRQCCCHPLLVGSELGQSAKLEALLLDLETVALEGKKGLIFSQFTEMLTLIGRELSHPYVRLDGLTRDREAVVRQFQEDPQIPFFLISLKAGGVGLNLTKADYVFLYDPWWNVSAENQAIDRAHRIGREGTVIAKRYIAAGTIEERLMDLKAKKLAMGEEILGEGSFTLADMEQLLFQEMRSMQ
ncbi:MAG: DEAD/DEAH box helicase, partial [Verrucomicrobia bacterium]|nr:DEAD/DEAH box helicase [Verrucomicrobiota bacterium]